MTYPSVFKPEQELILNEIIPQLEKLKPGQLLTVEHIDPKALSYRRYLLYAWLSPMHSNQKSLFKIINLSPKKFQILRKTASPAKVAIQSDPQAEFVMEHLLDVTSQDLALKIIRDHYPDPVDQIKVLNEWRSTMGI